MHSLSSILIPIALLVEAGSAAYDLNNNYTPANFFSAFTFFTGSDPTGGYVTYLDRADATNDGLISTDNDQVYIGVDSTNVASGTGRKSVRITSNASYNLGLFILDVAHMPGGICGTWPAYWMVGPDWPSNGEIDILEGVNDNANNAMTLHTSESCTITSDSTFTGTLTTTDCYIRAAGQSPNAGCSFEDQESQSYGSNFNAIGGGVVAVEWTDDIISIWFFPRGTTPADLEAGDPDPSSWGAPVAQYRGGCDISSHFADMHIVINTDFCGDWAGNAWSASSHCSSLADACNDYVQNNPTAFSDAYWSINYLSVYQSNGTTESVGHVANTTSDKATNETAPLLTQPLAMGGGSPENGKRGS